MIEKGFLGVLGLWALALVPAGADTISLDQAVQEALTKGADQAIWAANLAASRSSEAVARARAGLTVSTNLGYTGTETWSDPGLGSDSAVPHNGSVTLTAGTPLTTVTAKGTRRFSTASSTTDVVADEATATLTQTLWNGYWGGAQQAAADKAAQTLKAAELNAQASKNKLVLAVKQAYFTLLSAQEALGQLSQTQKQRQDSLRFARTKFDLGQATTLDLKQAQINAKSADLDLTAGQSTLDSARRRLANLLGRADGPLTVAAESDPEIQVSSVEAAVDAALRQRVEPQTAMASVRSSEIDLASAIGAATPSVVLSGTVNYTKYPTLTKVGNNLLNGAFSGSVSVNIGAPLVDGGLAAAQRAQAEAQKTAAQTQYQQVLKSIAVDVAEAWNNWQVNQGRVEVAGLALEVAQGQRLVVQTQYDAGLKTLTDLQTSDIALSASQLALLKAKITAQLSALTLQSLMGQ